MLWFQTSPRYGLCWRVYSLEIIQDLTILICIYSSFFEHQLQLEYSSLFQIAELNKHIVNFIFRPFNFKVYTKKIIKNYVFIEVVAKLVPNELENKAYWNVLTAMSLFIS